MISSFTRILTGAAAFAVLSGPALAADMTPEEQAYLQQLEEVLPGTLVNNPLDTEWRIDGSKDNFKTKSVRSDVLPTGMAFQIKTKRTTPNPWGISVSVPVEKGVESGDALLLSFYARATSAPDDTGQLQARLQQVESPYTGLAESMVEISEDWRIYNVPGQADQSYGKGRINVSLNVGAAKQTLEFGPVYVMNLGPDVDVSSLPSGSDPVIAP